MDRAVKYGCVIFSKTILTYRQLAWSESEIWKNPANESGKLPIVMVHDSSNDALSQMPVNAKECKWFVQISAQSVNSAD